MAFYYVKSGGTATGDAGRATSARTGSFATMGASAYYDSLQDLSTVPTTAVDAGDIIYVSDAHNKVYGSPTTDTLITFPQAASIGMIKIIAVDDLNADTLSSADISLYNGARETHGDGLNINTFHLQFRTNTSYYFWGINFYCDANDMDMDAVTSSTEQGIRYKFENCSFQYGSIGSPQYLRIQTDSGRSIFKDCYFNASLSGSSGYLMFGRNTIVDFETCTFKKTSAGNNIWAMIDTNGGSQVNVYGCDLSEYTAMAMRAGYNTNNGIMDPCVINFYDCKMGSNWDSTASQSSIWLNTDIEKSFAHEANFYNCSNALSSFYCYNNGLGHLSSNFTTYYNATDRKNSSFSYNYKSSSRVNESSPFKTRIATLTNQDLTSAQTYQIEFTSDTLNLNKSDVHFEARYPDTNTKGIVSTSDDGTIIAPSTTVHTTSTETWTSPLTYRYKDSITTTVQAGKTNENVEIWAVLKRPDEDMIISPSIGIL